MCLISLWLPHSPWNLSYNTYRDTPDQQGTAMVRRKGGQGASDERTFQWKAQGIVGIWALLMAEGLFALLPPRWAVPGLFLRELSNGRSERQEMSNARIIRIVVMARMLWARTGTERLEYQEPTVQRVQSRITSTATQGPLGVAAQEPSKIPAPLVTHHNCCWTRPAILKH